MKVKSLLTQYFQGEQVYNYGGQVPPILFPDAPSPTPSITPSPTPTPSITPTLTTTPTPTTTTTQTPTITPTNTNTPTNTKTPTPTKTSTQTPTPTNTTTPTPTPTPLLFTYGMSDCITGGTALGNYTTSLLVPGDIVKSAVNNRCYTIQSPSPFNPIGQTLSVGTFPDCPTCIGYTQFTGLLFDGSSAIGACTGISTPDAWGNNPVWSSNTNLYTDPYTLNPYPPGYINNGGEVLQIGTGGVILGSSVCPSPTPTPTITSTMTPTPTITPTITPTTTITPTPTSSPLVSSITYITSGGDDNNQQTYTFNGANIGGPGLIVVVVQCDTLNPGSISSVSIGGTNGVIATQITENNSLISCIASRRITGGTSTNIVITLSSNIGVACRIGVYRLQDISSDTANLTNSSGGSGTSASANLVSLGANACVVSSIILQGTSAITWTGPTEDYDVIQEVVRASAASIKRTASGTFNISASWGSSHSYAITSAAWI